MGRGWNRQRRRRKTRQRRSGMKKGRIVIFRVDSDPSCFDFPRRSRRLLLMTRAIAGATSSRIICAKKTSSFVSSFHESRLTHRAHRKIILRSSKCYLFQVLRKFSSRIYHARAHQVCSKDILNPIKFSISMKNIKWKQKFSKNE